MNKLIFQTKKIPSNWQRIIEVLTTPDHLAGDDVQGIDRAYVTLLWLHRVYTLEMMVKLEWDNKLKLHIPHGSKASYCVLAEFWRRVLIACDRLQNIYPYHANSAEWFAYLFTERALEGLGLSKGKKLDISTMQSQNRKFSSLDPEQNPFSQSITPHTYFFTNCLIEQSGRSPRFMSEVARPLIKSRMDLIKQMRTDKILSLWIEDDGVYITRPGTKRSKQKLMLKK
ncbi:hypothetical protein H6G80_03920 [Nostoc sp. FACHB-87]|uniref:hypothetical protein n=1 Tax=Nostocaceae TaxID=1162 RepID=UPI0016847649|nr:MULTISPECIES: hypothetical protein [Nostocaceae]MBD2453222.1 hypothetical protein [Nostoc sp. FACHB-87]MBD2474998.1 hypothetical protein [Anabaena sp. FACHB-83]